MASWIVYLSVLAGWLYVAGAPKWSMPYRRA